MKLIWVVACLSLLVLLPACSQEEEYSDVVTVIITENGMVQKVTDIKIDNYYPGARVDVKYLVVNFASKEVKPTLYSIFKVNPADYRMAKDYVAVPSYYSDWVDIPNCGTLEPGQRKSYTLVLKIPEDTTEKIPAKWTFQTGVTDGKGGEKQLAYAVWWRVNMR